MTALTADVKVGDKVKLMEPIISGDTGIPLDTPLTVEEVIPGDGHTNVIVTGYPWLLRVELFIVDDTTPPASDFFVYDSP